MADQPLSTRNQNKSSKLKDLSQKILISLYELYYMNYKLYNFRYRFRQGPNRLIFLLMVLLQTVQIQSLVLFNQSAEYQPYQFSTVTKMLRLDYILALIGLFEIGFLILASILALLYAVFFYYYLKIFLYGQKKQSVVYFFHFPMQMINKMGYVAFMSVLIGMFKHTYTGKVENQYEDIQIQFTGAVWQGYIGVFFALILTVLNIFQVVFNYEQFVGRMNKNLMSRSHGSIEAYKTVFLCLVVFSHFFLRDFLGILGVGLDLSLFVILTALYYYYMPFYNSLTNFIYTAQSLSVVLYIGCMIIGLGIRSNLLLVLSVLILNPLCFYILWDLIQTRYEVITKDLQKTQQLNSVFNYEMLLRKHIIDYIEGNQACYQRIKEIFIQLYEKFQESKFPSLWWFTLCFFFEKDQAISSVKLSLASNCKFNLQSNYHFFKYSKLLEDFSLQYIEEADFLRFSSLYRQALKQDKMAFQLQYQFWTELSKEQIRFNVLQELGYQVSQSVSSLLKLNQGLISKYPNNPDTLSLYGSFIAEFYHDQQKGNEYLSKSENIRQSRKRKNKNSKKLDYFDETIGIITVSGKPESTGRILTINSQAQQILQISGKLARKMNISNFLPPPYNQKKVHDMFLAKFARETDHVFLNNSLSNIMIDYNGYLVDVSLLSKLLSVNNNPCYLTAVKKYSGSRQIALINQKGVILANSRNFSVLLQISEAPQQLNNISLENLIPQYEEMEEDIWYKSNAFITTDSDKRIYLEGKEYIYNDSLLYVLYATRSKQEKNAWRTTKTQFRKDYTKKYSIKLWLSKALKRGILKPPRSNYKKDLAVRFNMNLQIHVLEATDFSPGRKSPSKQKDANFKKMQKLPSLQKIDFTNIVDLGEIDNLQNFFDNTQTKKELEDPESPKLQKKSNSKMSMASSSSGQGASVAASEVVSNLWKSTNTDISRIKIILLVTIIIMIMCNIVTVIYSQLLVKRLTNSVSIDDISDQYWTISKLSLDARIAQLVSQGFINYKSYQEAIQQIENSIFFINEVHQAQKEAFQSIEELAGFFSDYQYVTLQKVNDNFQEIRLNLDNIVQKTIIQGQSMIDLSIIDQKNKHFYFLYRNCMFETTDAMNQTLYRLKFMFEDEILNLQYTILILIISTFGVLVLSIFLGIIPLLRTLERGIQIVWKILFCLPLEAILEIRERIEDRLDSIHNFNPPVNSHRLFKDIQSRKKIKPTKKCWYILKRLLIFYIITVATIFLIYQNTFLQISKIMSNKVSFSILSAQRIFYTVNVCFWNLEKKLQETQSTYNDIIPQFQQKSGFEDQLEQGIKKLRQIQHQIVIQKYSNTGQSNQHRDALFDTGCLEKNFLKFGVHSGIDQLSMQSVADLIQVLVEEGKTYQVLEYTEDLVYCLGMLKEMYQEQFLKELEEHSSNQIWICVGYSLVNILMFVFFYIPAFNSIRNRTESIWELTRLVPMSQRRVILSVIKER